VSALIKDIKNAADMAKEIWTDFNEAVNNPFDQQQTSPELT
jgi:hypothetical protein